MILLAVLVLHSNSEAVFTVTVSYITRQSLKNLADAFLIKKRGSQIH